MDYWLAVAAFTVEWRPCQGSWGHDDPGAAEACKALARRATRTADTRLGRYAASRVVARFSDPAEVEAVSRLYFDEHIALAHALDDRQSPGHAAIADLLASGGEAALAAALGL
jgi:hypothetical protein